MNQATVTEKNPQAIFWKESAVEVPETFKAQLKTIFGVDEFGDPIVRVRFDNKKFKEGVWIVEEKWSPSAFGSVEEWNKTKTMYEDGVSYDFGDFPSRGIYAAMFVWADHEGRSLPLCDDLIERLKYQRHARETKNISPEQVMLAEIESEARVERQQEERFKEAQAAVAEDIKMRAEKIIGAATWNYSVPTVKANKILPIN